MIHPTELRAGNLLTWNPKLLHLNSTLPPMQVQVASILPDKISYVFPNIENRVEPFEDDIAQTGTRYKSFAELEPIVLTPELLINAGFEEKTGLFTSSHFEKGDLQLKAKGEYFEMSSTTKSKTADKDSPIKYLHQLQNLYFERTGEELEIKLDGQ